MKIVKNVLDRSMVKVGEMQFGFIPGKGTIDAVFILRRLQKEYFNLNELFCVYQLLIKQPVSLSQYISNCLLS